ncbi:response regulator [Fibrella sp. USSR17]
MPTILLADDEPSTLLSLEFLMKKQGYRVFIARDGQEAHHLIQQELPDVLLINAMSPRMDGPELCRFMRAEPACLGMKLIVLSAKSEEVSMRAGYEAGADLCLTKPFSPRRLLKKMNELLITTKPDCL